MKNTIVLSLLCIVIMAGTGYAEQSLEPLTIQLDWFNYAKFSGIFLAKERGWYEEAGIDLTIQPWVSGIEPIQEVLEGRAQIGIEEGVSLIHEIASGASVKAIAAQFQKSPFCLMSKKEDPITSPEQLAGKRIAISNLKQELMVKIMLASVGLKYEQITPVQYKGDIDFLIEDKVDAMSAFMNNQPLVLKSMGYDVTYIPAFQHGYGFYSGVFFTSDDLIQQKPNLLQKFLEVTFRAWHEAFVNIASTAQLVVEEYAPHENIEQQTESLQIFRMLAIIGEGKKFLGWMEEKTWAAGIDILYEFQQIDRTIAADSVFTNQFLENIYFGK